MRISVLVGTRNREAALRRCLASLERQDSPPHEIIVLDDASDSMRVLDAVNGSPNLRVIRSETQLGVGRGRNLLYREASGDILFVMDDDAYLEDSTFLSRLGAEMASRPSAAIIAARIIDHRASGDAVLAPFPRRARRADPGIVDRDQRVSYFLGGGHALSRVAYDRIGGYDETFVWGEEELDLSFRAINAGFEIHYVPSLTVHHAAEQAVLRSSRQPRSELYYHVRNRFVIAAKFLPTRYALAYLAGWIGRYGVEAVRGRDLAGWMRGIRDGASSFRLTKREPLTPQALVYLRRHSGRLWY
jgi:GT2 family glycosyltransferase